ncbi:MAG TPA: hypothetical protein EYO01_01875 [Phycisphaerales bacterium]|jgi:hypothetical protein|nr:hypothetical protein [Phycisphaerales bacterium]HIN83746.1 hypothetical protein [Phycisphaerales bacterium]HIO52415.1 hypothetical protein [Phycisphaerales bacterium]
MRLFFLIILIISGCSQRSNPSSLEKDVTPEMVRVNQIERTASFDTLVGRGVVEFRWEDDDGKHKEQGDLDFWKHEDSISLRISKLGELLIWFGGDKNENWFFDMLGDETTLTMNSEGAMFSDITTALVLLGLSPLPNGEMNVSAGVVTLVDEEGRVWTATFDKVTHRPLQMSVVDGEHISSALHRSGINVEIENLHALNWPVSGGLIDFKDSRGSTEVKISFSSLSTVVAEEPMDRVLNVSYLQSALKPSRIE